MTTLTTSSIYFLILSFGSIEGETAIILGLILLISSLFIDIKRKLYKL